MSPNSVFFHVDLDAFFASVEQRDNPDLRGKPVIIGILGPRMVVSTCSYEARKYKVHSAMPTLQAQKLCPQGIFLPGNMQKYSKVSRQVMEILHQYSPDMRQASIDEAYLDMTGTRRLFGSPWKVANEIKERIRTELGLTISIGIAASPFIAKMASDYKKPDGLCIVGPGNEQRFVDAIGLKNLWGLGESGLRTLTSKGITTPEMVRDYSLEELQKTVGSAFGSYLYNACRGIDPGILSGETKSHSMSSETTFTEDICDEQTLHQVLLGLSQELMSRSLDENVMARTVGLKLRWGDFRTITVQETPDEPILNGDRIFAIAKRLLASRWKQGQGIRLIGLGLYQTYSGSNPIQDSLFSLDEHKKRDLDKTVHELSAKGMILKKASELEKPETR